MNVIELKMIRDLNNFTDRELEVCCAIANRFEKGNLRSAAFELNWYKRDPNTKFIKEGVKNLIEEMQLS